ncbi:serine/threonine-protein kinase HT1-like protein [Corchorus olitorius]|uniref:Serine/threonine-protein kinase HT1-like protein n=1 Tax=Corchorus olitorius TaxID=93759 RepID=A0A1R3GP66_9ROSI|nr:serine/threonine-protein kinase HT1-like protein [Corchorus olitorius]
MKENNDGFVRADQIDLKSLDEQLERHLNRLKLAPSSINKPPTFVKKERLEWEIDPSKLIIKTVIARGTFGTVHLKLLDWGEEGHRTEAEIASLRAAFSQEVAVWHKLEHPNVTKVNS